MWLEMLPKHVCVHRDMIMVARLSELCTFLISIFWLFLQMTQLTAEFKN